MHTIVSEGECVVQTVGVKKLDQGEREVIHHCTFITSLWEEPWLPECCHLAAAIWNEYADMSLYPLTV